MRGFVVFRLEAVGGSDLGETPKVLVEKFPLRRTERDRSTLTVITWRLAEKEKM